MGNDTEILGQTDGHAFILVIFINDFINLLFKLMECQINSVFSCYKAGHKVWFQTSESESIIGATKTLIRSDFKNEEKNQAIQTNKKPALKMDNTIITQQFHPKSKKPKLGL